MAASASSPGCLVYFFLAALTAFGYLPLGRHGADFSADSKKIAYKYNESEVRIRDLASGAVSPALYTAPEGWILNSVHWNHADGKVYAVAHQDPSCQGEANDTKWSVRLIRVDPAGGAHTVTERSYYCLMTGLNKMDSAFNQDSAPPALAAAYQDMNLSVSFKPMGWRAGTLYFMEPEEFASDKPVIKSMDLATGKEKTEFALPGGAYSYLLSPNADYLVSLSEVKDETADRIVMELRALPSNKVTLKETIAQRPCKNGDCTDVDTGFWILSGAEGAASFDEAAGKFFYLKLDPDTTGTGLYALDLKSGKTTLVHKSFDITFFMPVPNRKAVLLTAADSRAHALLESWKDGPSEMLSPDIANIVKTRLVSYEGETLREYDVPPVLSAYVNGVRPDAALSPDGNLAAVTLVNMFDMEPAPGAAAPEPATIPALLNLEKGTLEFLITEPVDNALAGLLHMRLGDPDAARPYLQALPRDLWDASPLTRDAAFALLAQQRRAGDPLADETYAALLKSVPAGADPHLDMARGYYRALTGAEALSANLAYGNMRLENLPAFNTAIPAADLKFLKSELDFAPEAWQSAFFLGALAAHEQRWADAATHLERAQRLSRDQATPDTPPLKMDFLMGQIHEKAGDFDKALARFESSGSSLEDIALAKAPVLEKLGRFEEAAEAYSYFIGSLKKRLKDLAAECKAGKSTAAECESKTKDINDQIEKYAALRAALRAKSAK